MPEKDAERTLLGLEAMRPVTQTDARLVLEFEVVVEASCEVQESAAMTAGVIDPELEMACLRDETKDEKKLVLKRLDPGLQNGLKGSDGVFSGSLGDKDVQQRREGRLTSFRSMNSLSSDTPYVSQRAGSS